MLLSEFITRFTCAPKKCEFLKSALNIIDLLAILPYFFGFVLEGMKDTLVVGRVGKVLRLVRVMRILRVFKVFMQEIGFVSQLPYVYIITACETLQWFTKFVDNSWSGIQRAGIVDVLVVCVCSHLCKVK